MTATVDGSAQTRELISIFRSARLADSVGFGLMLIGRDGFIVDCNDTALSLLGLPLEEVVGSKGYLSSSSMWSEFNSPLHEEERPSTRTLRTGETVKGAVLGLETPGRARLWLLVSTSPILLNGAIEGVIVSMEDVTKAHRDRRFLSLRTETGRITILSSSESEYVQKVCNALVEEGEFALAWFGELRSGEGGGIEVLWSAGPSDYFNPDTIAWWGSSKSEPTAVASALRSGRTRVVNDAAAQEETTTWRERPREFELNSFAAICMSFGERRVVVTVYDRSVDAFDADTIEIIEQILSEVEVGLDHVRSLKQLRASLDGTLGALSEMTELRDEYTAGHQNRVGLLASAIAARMNLSSSLVELIRQGGEVHDIGKICVPSEILTAPRKLSSLEFQMIQVHPRVGYEILSRAELPWPIAQIALQHHERLDGSGYPNGLAGEDIILPARIVAVADVVEAMGNHQPYRPSVGLKKALAELVEHAGTLYDRDVVAACIELFESGFEFSTSRWIGVGEHST